MLKWVKIVCVILIGAFLMAEVSARIWVVHFAPDNVFFYFCSIRQYNRHGQSRCRLLPHPYLGYVPNPGTRDGGITINAQGYRGSDPILPKRPGELRIVCAGGSTTFDDEIECDDQTYPARMQHYMREAGYDISVVNAGVSGWTSYETVINYAFRLSYLEPDLIICMHTGNDLSARLVYPPEAYRSDNTGARSATLEAPPLWQDITLIRIPLILANKIPSPATTAMNQFAPTFRIGFPYDPFFKEHPLEQILEQNPPTYVYNNLRHLAAMASADGVQTLLITMPFSRRHEAFTKSFGIASDDEGLYRTTLKAFDDANAVVARAAQEAGCLFFDLAEAYPDLDDYTVFFASGFHNNPAGADKKAQLLSAFLIDHEILPQPEPGTVPAAQNSQGNGFTTKPRSIVGNVLRSARESHRI